MRRVLDSAPLYDTVATQDTVTLVRSAIRGLLRACDQELEDELRDKLQRDDDYAGPGKPVCDWDDPEARATLVDELVNDGLDVLEALQGRKLDPDVSQAAELLATVVGQDVEHCPDEVFRIARRTVKDRIISTVDPDARHGHKTSARGFDGYKRHISIDPDSEIITAAGAGPANQGDGDLLPELLDETTSQDRATSTDGDDHEHTGDEQRAPIVYGDAAYGSGKTLEHLDQMDAVSMLKVQAPSAPNGHFPKDRFGVDLEAKTVTCPNDVTVALRPARSGGAYAKFGAACASCPLRDSCTDSPTGRVVTVGPYETLLAAARQRQKDPGWQADYRAHRPKVERKLAHMLRRRHGGRRARVRGRKRVDQDWKLLAAAVNLARLAALGLNFTDGGTSVDTHTSSIPGSLRRVLPRLWGRSHRDLRVQSGTGRDRLRIAAGMVYSAPAT